MAENPKKCPCGASINRANGNVLIRQLRDEDGNLTEEREYSYICKECNSFSEINDFEAWLK